MKDSYLINYKLFCSRKKFSLKNYLQNHRSLSYEDLKKHFYSLSVEPPSEEIFLKTQKQINELDKEKPKAVKKTQVNTAEVVEVVEENAKPQPKKRRRRRKTKND